MKKDIMIIRLAEQYPNSILNEVTSKYKEKLKDEFYVFVVLGENDTNKTEFEIITR